MRLIIDVLVGSTAGILRLGYKGVISLREKLVESLVRDSVYLRSEKLE
jgi:hypothetical protein